MVSCLNRSDASKGFNKVIDFLDGSYIKYALTVNPNIYVSCIKQFLTTVVVKQDNDVTRLQALVDRKKVVVTEAAIREVLRLDDAKGVDCLPNEEIFVELARMGRKFNFSKYIFDSLVRNEDNTSKFYLYPRFIQFLIRNQLGVETPLFEGMIVEQVIEEGGAVGEHVEDDNASQGDDTTVQGDAAQELTIPSPTPPTPLTPPTQQPQDIPSTSQVQHTSPHSPQLQPQPQPQAQQQAADFPMSLLQEALHACADLTRRVKHLEYDKVAQALEITKLKKRVKKLEKGNMVKVLKLRRLKKVGTSQRIDTSEDTMMEDASNQGRMIDDLNKDDVVALMDDKEEEKKEEEAKVADDDQVQERQAEIYKIDMDHASKVLSMQEDEPAEVQEVVDVVTTAKLITEVVTTASETLSAAEPQVPAATITAASVRVAAASTRRKKGVVIRDPEEESSTVIPADTKSKDKGKGIMVEEPKPLKKKQHVEMDEEYARKLHAELNKDIDWDVAIEHTEAQARKNMIMYLKNVAGLRLDYFKGMSYDDIHPIFEAKFNSNIEFLLKTKEQMKEEESRAIQSINETPTQKAAKRRKLNEELILLVERRYPLSRFTLNQMLNVVRLRVEEQSEMSLELLSQDKYVAEILRKFGLTKGKSASTSIDTEKPLLKDPDGEDVDVHTYSKEDL
nr:ribonuclease H-like domain-containing protein [Tanacetum cinerariifolium]